MKMKFGRYLVLCPAMASAIAFPASGDITVKTGICDVKIECKDPGKWKFATKTSEIDGVTYVKISLDSPTEAIPPRFLASFSVSGAGADQLWTPDRTAHHSTIYPKEWYGCVPKYVSELALNAPIATVYRESGQNTLAFSISEAFRKLKYDLAIGASDCRLYGRAEFFTAVEAPLKSYQTVLRIDPRPVFWADAVRDASKWISDTAGLKSAHVPESAREPMYSSWYAFWQDVRAEDLEREAPIAASLGMKAMILDDGWQKEKSRTYYSATGDWRPAAGRFPDMKAHVDAVHRAGLKYILWLSVPFVGDESEAWHVFKDKFLYLPTLDNGGMGVLDPRYPDIREHLVSTYERVVRDWGFDGLKLDFIDWFKIEGVDPAVAQNYAGRDCKSVPEAVDILMKEVVKRLTAINPEILIEFRQRYMGPAIRQYGNMIRAQDCPVDPARIRRLVSDLRLTSGNTPVHSDMLIWSGDEKPERAARPILSSIFSVIQYSMVLARIPPRHKDVIRHYLDFTKRHRKTLLDGEFIPHRPDLGYPRLEAVGKNERIVAVYSEGQVVDVDPAVRNEIILNGTESGTIVVDFKSGASTAVSYDAFGNREVLGGEYRKGLSRIEIKPYGRVEFGASKGDGR